MKKSIKKALVMFLSVAMVFSMMIVPTYADELMDAADAGSYVEEVRSAATVEDVLAAIGELSNDPRDYTAADKEKVEAIQADYEALSADDQAIIDSTKNHPSGDGQSYGRVLEAAVWAVRSFDTDVTTTLTDGTYTTTTDPAVSSQSDKGKSDSSRTRNWWVESVTVENGQATAYIYVTDGESTGSKLTSYPSVWIGGQTIARDENNNYAIPVDLNGTTYFGGISSSMPRPIMYALSTTITEPGATEPGEGTVYTGDAIQFTFTDVEGVFDLVSCEKVTVLRGDAVAELKIQFIKDSGHRIAIEDIIDGTNGPSLSYTKDDQEIATVQVPVTLGEEHTISAMDDIEGDYWPIRFTVNVTGQEPQAIDLTIVNNTGMFKAVTASAIENSDGSATLTMALSGSGYHYLYKGTYEQAVANGAHTENWIEGYLNDAGLWEFKIPMEASELGKLVPVTAVSQSYYEKYLNGQNSIDRAFYPRQLTLDLEAATLVTDDYKTEKEITVTNHVSMFKPGPKATLECVGGPNSNNYKADLVLPMESTSLSNVFVGSFAEAEAATNTIAFNADDKTFTIPVKWVATFGKPETLVNHANGETFYMSFKSASNGKWYERKATLDENAGTLVFDPSNADYTAVTAAQAAAAAIDRDLYTEESLAALDAALNAVVTGKFESQQAEVDAMAQAINDAIAALVENGPQAIELTITNNTGMFKAVTASAVKNEDGSAVLTMALSGSGYHYLYKGTYEQAVANGAHTENWIEGYLNDAGLWEFKIPMEASELGKTVPVTAVSQSYYEKYLNGQNSIDRAFYPRQLNLDLEAATLVTDDYKTEKEITVTNNVPMFKPGTKATLDCVGGPNSNNYKADLILPMQSTSLSNVFVGSFAEAEAATNTIAFNADDKTFTIPVKWVATFGKPETLVNLANGETFYMSFKSASNGKWYERKATLDENAGTLVFDPSNADYTAVTAAQAAAAAIDRDLYTEESLAELDAALAAVTTGKFESQQAEVDAMAQAINDAIAALVEKPHPEKAVLRIYGKDRVKTSLKIADELLALSESDKFDKVILASGINYPDALAGSHLSCAGNCPILLLDGNSANLAAVQDYIKENLAEGGTIYMLGGAAAVPEEAAAGLGDYEIVRLGGKDRYATDLMILEEGLKLDPEADEILVSTAFGFADSLSAASVGKPILLVGAALTDSQKEFLAGLEGDYTFTAVGGTAVVSEAVMEELKAYGETDRVSGKDRYQTSVAVANKYFEKPEFGVLAYALNYPDGLCGGGLAYAMKAPLILTNDGATGPAVAFAEENGMTYGAVLGGTGLISDDSVRAIFHMGPEDEIVVK